MSDDLKTKPKGSGSYNSNVLPGDGSAHPVGQLYISRADSEKNAPKKMNPFVFALAIIGGGCILAGGRVSPVGSLVLFVVLVCVCAWSNRKR